MNNNDIVLELSQISRDLQQAAHDIARLDRDAVLAKSRHRKAYAIAYTTGTGSIKDREQSAILKTEEELLTYEIAAQVLRASQESIRVMRNRLDILRSLGAAHRSEFAAEATGQRT